jgi:hypothetical protein
MLNCLAKFCTRRARPVRDEFTPHRRRSASDEQPHARCARARAATRPIALAVVESRNGTADESTTKDLSYRLAESRRRTHAAYGQPNPLN